MSDSPKNFSLNDPARIQDNPRVNDSETQISSPEDKAQRSDEKPPASGHRRGEVPFMTPEPQHVNFRRANRHEQQAFEHEDTTSEHERLNRLAIAATEHQGLKWPSWLKKTFTWLALGITSLIVLVFLGQVTNFLAQFKSLPIWSQWVVGSCLCVVGVVIVYLTARLFVAVVKLKRNDQIDVAVIRQLNERQALQGLAHQKNSDAVKKLKKYLKDYPEIDAQKLPDFDPDKREELQNVRERLMSEADTLPAQKWLDIYQSGFQFHLDEKAVALCKSYSKRAALKTAVSPLPILDTGIMLALSLSMINDMLRIYNLKTGGLGSSYILVHVIGQAYVAGELQDVTESLTDSLSSFIAEHLGLSASSITQMVSAKTGEGLANGIMMYRLASTTSRLLRPMRV